MLGAPGGQGGRRGAPAEAEVVRGTLPVTGVEIKRVG